MKIVITIKNNSLNNQKVLLLNAMMDGFPDGISVSIRIIHPDGSFSDKTYNTLLEYTMMVPQLVNVIKTTNNRQLDFFNYDIRRFKHPCEPGLTIDKKPRQRKQVKDYNCGDIGEGFVWVWEYSKKWNPKKWNIADTGEWFILDGKCQLIELDILQKQEFEIVLNVSERIKLANYLKK